MQNYMQKKTTAKLLLLRSKTSTATLLMGFTFLGFASVGCTPKALDPAQGHLDNYSAAAPNGATGTTNIGGRADDKPMSGTASGTTQAPSASASPSSAAPPADAVQTGAMSAPSAAASPKPAVKDKKHK